MMIVRLGLVQGCVVPNNRSSLRRETWGRECSGRREGLWWLEARQVGAKRRHPVYISEPHACAANAVSWDGPGRVNKCRQAGRMATGRPISGEMRGNRSFLTPLW